MLAIHIGATNETAIDAIGLHIIVTLVSLLHHGYQQVFTRRGPQRVHLTEETYRPRLYVAYTRCNKCRKSSKPI